jgi:hypothetical protein
MDIKKIKCQLNFEKNRKNCFFKIFDCMYFQQGYQEIKPVRWTLLVKTNMIHYLKPLILILNKPHTVYVGRVCPAAGCKINFQICIEVTVATAHPTINLVEFQHTSAGHTRGQFSVKTPNFRQKVHQL